MGKLRHQHFHPLALVEHRTELCLEGQSRERLPIVIEGVFQIAPHEVGGVSIAGSQDVLVALDDALQAQAVPIAHTEEVGQQRPTPSDREVALMLLHHRRQHLLGQCQVLLSEAAPKDGRRFHQVGHFIQQVVVLGVFAVHLSSHGRCLTRDLLPSLPWVEHNAGLAENP